MKRGGTFYGLIAALMWQKTQMPVWQILLLLLVLYTILGGYSYLKIVVLTLKRDLTLGMRYGATYINVKRQHWSNTIVPTIFEENVKKHPNKICFHFEGASWTFKQINDLSNRVAHVFEEAGFKRGDTVALLLDNRPEYVAIWLGLSKVGIVTALVNYNLRDKPLLHALKIVDSKALIFGADFVNAVESVRQQLNPSMKLYGFDYGDKQSQIPAKVLNMDKLLKEASSEALEGPQRSDYGDRMLYIYTSGTTGLPKAAVIKHSRFLFAAYGGYFGGGLNLKDSVYVCLPLYHSTGGIMGIGAAVVKGCTVALRRKFSATNFWADCIQYDCTVAQYIGEMCRYLLATPPRPEDRKHRVRLMYGVGLRPQIWTEFIRRFNIGLISEFYGASEGNASTVNFDGTVGSIGFVSLIAPSIYPITLIRVDEDTGEPVRDKDGLCIRCQPGEPGMFVSKIKVGHPISDLPGYSDPNATRKKIARDVLSRGDSFFLSGDILVMDELGYLFFKDRTGDTFRWKGENVSTTEVEAVISNNVGLRDCCVYGIEVTGSEGRAGMAAIVDSDKNLDLGALAKELSSSLPTYSLPLFIRLVSTMDLTGTYKLRKVDYQSEGYDLNKIKDPVYFWDASSRSYISFTSSLQQQLMDGRIRI